MQTGRGLKVNFWVEKLPATRKIHKLGWGNVLKAGNKKPYPLVKSITKQEKVTQ
ncbi:hypothetical protein GXM_04420 [Nostoc sphaeroides CCNUC1]|uniref:Uncharacterized protein n=1 Tax=Nostoc sphaeroides CCNUC1 TaxID=2653204 RepID=A0A5P8W4J8_9NOSO|nr:hypothetical protein GXM_04420 [Nostoc sphaeroides CCNUC1]